MGLFNIIRCDLPCPGCGRAVEWQSQFARARGTEVPLCLDTIDLGEVSVGEMHTLCYQPDGGCGRAWDCEIVDGVARNCHEDIPMPWPREGAEP